MIEKKDGGNMNHETNMAQFICELRKSKHMTQKQLAEKLNVTDKAVSKWERAAGCPDITILPQLAEELGVTVNELLDGKREEIPDAGAAAAAEKTLQYANRASSEKKDTVRLILKAGMTAAFLLAIFICVLCDFAVHHAFTWSLYPIASVLFAWLVLTPALQFKKHPAVAGLVSLSLFVVPFLAALQRITGEKMVLAIGVPCALIGLAYLWGAAALFSFRRLGRWNAAAWTLLLAIPVSGLINAIVDGLLNQPGLFDVWDLLSYGILALSSIPFFVLGWRAKKRPQ